MVAMVSSISNSRVVLVVEDDPLIRMSAVDLVEAAGFDAIEAANADQAVQALAANPTISTVFTDISMPGKMDGLELAAHVKAQWPSIRIIVASGQKRVEQTDIPDGSLFFEKPYDVRKITAAMQSAG